MAVGSARGSLVSLAAMIAPAAALAHPGHGSLHSDFLGLDPVTGLALFGLGFCAVMLGAYALAPRIARLLRRRPDKADTKADTAE